MRIECDKVITTDDFDEKYSMWQGRTLTVMGEYIKVSQPGIHSRYFDTIYLFESTGIMIGFKYDGVLPECYISTQDGFESDCYVDAAPYLFQDKDRIFAVVKRSYRNVDLHKQVIGLTIIAGADVCLDFSGVGALQPLLGYLHRTKTALVSGTTGLTEPDLDALQELGRELPVIWTANYSTGIAVFRRMLHDYAGVLAGWDKEIVEIHHNQKADAPSGTAKLLLQELDPEGTATVLHGREGLCGKRKPEEIGVFSLRGGTVAGEHTVYFFGEDETRPQMERVEKFLKTICNNIYKFDTASLPLPNVDPKFRGLFSPLVMHCFTSRIEAYQEDAGKHPLAIRRYYRQLSY